MKIAELALWEAFQGVAAHEGFSKAAKHLRIGAPQLTKRIAKLEDHLGVRLFTRSTRTVTLTDEGKSLLPKVNSILEDLQNIENSFESQTHLSGLIRITTVMSIAHRFLIPVISEFSKRHPEIKFELDLSESLINMVESNTDIAFRIHSEPSDSSLIYRKLVPNELVFCASPQYLKNTDQPLKKPVDLRLHPFLMLGVLGKCKLKDGSYKLAELKKIASVSCNNGWFYAKLALAGQGVLVRSLFDVQEDLKQGNLVQVLPKYPIEPLGYVYAVLQNRRYLTPRVRTFLDFATERAAKYLSKEN